MLIKCRDRSKKLDSERLDRFDGILGFFGWIAVAVVRSYCHSIAVMSILGLLCLLVFGLCLDSDSVTSCNSVGLCAGSHPVFYTSLRSQLEA